MIWYVGGDMFRDWTIESCPVIPTNLTKYANAGIAAEIRKHTPGDEFADQHARNPKGGILQFSDGRIAWDLPTKKALRQGEFSDIDLMRKGFALMLLSGINRLKTHGIKLILVPKVGTGYGGLSWPYVWSHIGPYVRQMSHGIDVWVYDEGSH
jgi:hypothetical protein